jgi:hypothetical protein
MSSYIVKRVLFVHLLAMLKKVLLGHRLIPADPRALQGTGNAAR